MDDREQLARAVRDACVRVAVEAYEDAGVRGLCAEGRWELALDALRAFDPLRTIEDADGLGELAPGERAPGGPGPG